jgi:hypothetical protein
MTLPVSFKDFHYFYLIQLGLSTNWPAFGRLRLYKIAKSDTPPGKT